MERRIIHPDINEFPDEILPILRNADIYDSSCSEIARVYFIDRDEGYYLKASPSGTLEKEAEMTSYFHKKGLATEVLAYISAEKDWMLTRRIKGEDCTYRNYLDEPEKLCETTAELLRKLHDLDFSDSPVYNRNKDYIETAEKNYRAGIFDSSIFSDDWVYSSAEEAWKVVSDNRHLLKNDVLLHGDYCLPNIILDNWKFSAFIDLGNGGVGDRHIDIFWGVWTLNYNLKTNKYKDRFLDAYGREDIEPEMLKVIAAFEVFG